MITTLSVSERAAASVAEWDALMSGDVRLGGLSWVASGFVASGNHHRAGTEADQRGRGGMSLGWPG